MIFSSSQHLGPFPCCSGIGWTVVGVFRYRMTTDRADSPTCEEDLMQWPLDADSGAAFYGFRIWELGTPGVLKDWGHADAHLDQLSPEFTGTEIGTKKYPEPLLAGVGQPSSFSIVFYISIYGLTNTGWGALLYIRISGWKDSQFLLAVWKAL